MFSGPGEWDHCATPVLREGGVEPRWTARIRPRMEMTGRSELPKGAGHPITAGAAERPVTSATGPGLRAAEDLATVLGKRLKGQRSPTATIKEL